MVSLDFETYDNNKVYLIVKMDLNELAVSVAQIDGIGEFGNDFHNKLDLEYCLGNYHNQNEIIPVLNLKKLLQCPCKNYNRTSQSRILFLRYSKKIIHEVNSFNIGFGVDAIVGLYHAVTLERTKNTIFEVPKELKCLQINSLAKINSKLYPILDLTKLLDFTLLKGTLEELLPEKI